MKMFIVGVFCTALIGCVSGEEVQAANNLCAANGGIDFIDATVDSYFCENGAKFSQAAVRIEITRMQGDK